MMKATPIYARIAECQALFGLSRSTIYRMKSRGEITIYKKGTVSLVKIAEMVKVIEAETL